MKKLFPDNKGSKKSILEFLDKKGFYIILILCIVIVGTTAVILTTRNINPQNPDYNLSNLGPEKIIPENEDVSLASGTVGNNPVQSSINNASPAPDKQVVATAVSNNKPVSDGGSNTVAVAAVKSTASNSTSKNTTPVKSQKFITPVFGVVTFDFAENRLVYSKTLEEWRTHSGVDIASDKGTPVKAVADGVVSEIKNDPRFGITVIIEHTNGIKTVYSNLASDDVVTPNQKVKQGDIIGSVGNTAAFEVAEQSHIHFEVWKNNEPVDPTAYLPK